MPGNYVYLILMWAGAVFCIGFGIYARNRKEPMWFWTGEKISPDKVKDVPAYNRAMGKMYCLCSVPFWIAGIIEVWYPMVTLIVFGLSCTAGIAWVVWYHDRIERKYKRK